MFIRKIWLREVLKKALKNNKRGTISEIRHFCSIGLNDLSHSPYTCLGSCCMLDGMKGHPSMASLSLWFIEWVVLCLYVSPWTQKAFQSVKLTRLWVTCWRGCIILLTHTHTDAGANKMRFIYSAQLIPPFSRTFLYRVCTKQILKS